MNDDNFFMNNSNSLENKTHKKIKIEVETVLFFVNFKIIKK
jgi:hypothetical protein